MLFMINRPGDVLLHSGRSLFIGSEESFDFAGIGRAGGIRHNSGIVSLTPCSFNLVRPHIPIT
jgi:hypothetical protein